jgi:heptaprenyl diphosphate synthase
MNYKKVPMYGMFIALALIMSYIESILPLHMGIPGAKIGLPNIVIVIALYKAGEKSACIISMIRIILVGFLFGNLFGIVYSIMGALFSLGVMILLKRKTDFSVYGVSTAGGIMHNAGQLVAAIIFMETKELIYYLPVLTVVGTITGILIGIVSGNLLKRLPS